MVSKDRVEAPDKLSFDGGTCRHQPERIGIDENTAMDGSNGTGRAKDTKKARVAIGKLFDECTDPTLDNIIAQKHHKSVIA